MAARCGEPSDYRRAAAHILAHNPLGGVCGSVCPDSLCMARCSRRGFDAAVNIPAVQAAIVRRATQLGVLPRFEPAPATGQRVAVVGAGPAGLAAASVLAKAGHTVQLFDQAHQPGGMARLIPRHRLDPEVLANDVAWLLGLGNLRLVLGKPVALPRDLLARGFAAVIVTAGLGEPLELDAPGHERAFDWTQLLGKRPPALRGKRVAIVGDGGVAVDCAEAALGQGAIHVELFARKKLSELELTRQERVRLFASGVHVTFRVRVTAVLGRGSRVTGLGLRKVELPPGEAFHPSRLKDMPGGEHERRDFDAVILALGGRPGLRREPHPRVVYAGDLETGPSSVVEALASGKRAGLAVHGMLAGDELAACPDRGSCPDGSGCPKRATCPEWNRPAQPDRASGVPRATAWLPVPLDTELLGRTVRSPFLLGPSPFTEGAAQVRRAYAAGWAGAVMRVAAPGRGPADAMDRLRADVAQLTSDFPDRLTVAAIDGARGERDGDLQARRELARRLEEAGAVVARDDDFDCGDGGPMDYLAAAERLAQGARSVQFASLVTKHGLGVVNELHGGLSHWLAERGLRSVSELVGSAPARPVLGEPPAGSAACEVDPALCTGCGNCTRCPRLAIALDARGIPAVDPDRCTGCALCVERCFAGALAMRRSVR